MWWLRSKPKPAPQLDPGIYAELLEMIVACEAELSVEFDSEADLSTETLGSIGSLAAVIEHKRGR